MNGGVPSKELNETLLNILDQLESDSNLLDNSNNIKYIISLLGEGADKNTKNQAGKTLSYYLDEHLLNILNDLKNGSNLLDNPNNIKYIGSLLKIGANPNVQNQAGRTLSYYLDKHLLNILNDLENDSNLLDNPNNIEYIGSLLGAGADPNVQNQAGKTLLHYVVEHNNIDAIRFLLSKKAGPSITDKSGKISAKYATESDCIRVLSYPDPDKDQGYHSDGSCENKENPANNSSNYPNRHNDDQTLRDDPGYGSGDDNKAISTEPSDCERKDEDSSCSSSDYLFLEDSLLAKLGIPLTTDEQELIDKFCEEIRGITTKNKQESEENILESIEKIVNEYLEKGLRLNSSCSNGNEKGDKETVTNLILEEIEGIINDRVKPRDGTKAYIGRVNDITDQDDDNEDKVSGIVENIASWLLLKGGQARQKFFFGNTELAQDYGFNYMNDLNKQYKDRKEELKSIECEGIVNKSKQIHEYDFKAEIDNVYFYVKYPQDSIIETVKILNNEKAKKLNLKVGILQIGESIVRIEGTKGGKRNYTDILEGSIKMSFTTEVGEISIYLSPSKKDGNKIEVKIDEESEARLNKLKAEKKSLGENCLLGGKNVLEAIEDKDFKKNGNVPTESIETIKDDPYSDLTQACPQQINTRVKGKCG